MTVVMPMSVATAREATEPVLRAAVARLDPLTARVASYHMGWTDTDGQPASASGKALRPTLVVLSARAARGSVEKSLPAAAAVELVHAFSLLHDDIMDGDETRRHRPTAWTVFGQAPALLAGDALLSLASELLMEEGTRGGIWAARCLTAATQRLIAGQALDLDFERRDDVGVAECQQMSMDKTGSLLACACSIGAMMVEGPSPLVAALAEFGSEIGMAFQLVDDLLGIWGAPDRTGKPVLSDLRSRKKSLPVVAAIDSGTPAGRKLAALLADPEPLTESDLYEAARLVEDAGGRDWATDEATRRVESAERYLAGADMPDDVRTEFLEIVHFVTSRDH